MPIQEMKWRVLAFNDLSDLGTDLFLYKDRSYLLLPSLGEENRFLIRAATDSVNFYIGSSSLKNLDMMSSFFQKMYNSKAEEGRDPSRTRMDNFVLLNSRVNKRFQEYYHPAFVRNIMQMPHHLRGLDLSYEVIIRSSSSPMRRRRFSFYIAIGIDADENIHEDAILAVKENIRSVREEARWKFILEKSEIGTFRFNLLKKPFALSSFVNIPTDEKNVDL